ncbi:MAG: SGNH/GDSL hydrolase family protein, partial [bacterium]
MDSFKWKSRISAIVRKTTYNVLLLAASTAVALLCSEIFLRLFFPVHPPRLISASGDDSWVLRDTEGEVIGPNPHFRGRLVSSEFDISVQLNEHGFRERAFAVKKASPAIRICVLGDSFTFGYGVEANEAYSQQLAQILPGRGYEVEVYNLGIPGTATAFQYQLMQKFLYLQPDIVILGILAAYADKTGNDLIGNLQFAEGHTIPSQLAPASMNNELRRADEAPQNRRLAKLLFYRLRSMRRW